MLSIQKIKDALFSPRDITSLIIFRVAFGAIMLWEVMRYFEKGWISKNYIDPVYNFSYGWFEWVKPWGGDGMYLHFYLLGILSVMIITGLFYRIAAVLMFFAFTYVFLLEQSRYLNHFYLVSLISFLMIFVPANRKYSLDAILWKDLKSDWIPAWTVMLLQFQIGVAYFFGGVAKMNYDWLFLAEPMQHWLSREMDYPLIGVFFDRPWMAYFMSWNGMLLDLSAPFLLLFRRTRPIMFTIILSFHFMNDRLFSIGIFPWFMILASTIFFPADWLKRLVNAIKENRDNQAVLILLSAIVFSFVGLYFHRNFELLPFMISALGGALLVWLPMDCWLSPTSSSATGEITHETQPASYRASSLIIAFLSVWSFFQIALPLRHYFIPGNASWTEEGHRWAWHMKLRGKSGDIKFYAYDPATGDRFRLKHKKYLTSRQTSKMSTLPYMIRQFAIFLHDELKKEGKGHYEVRVESFASLNYRPFQRMIDPDVNLAAVSYSEFRRNPWILHLDESLRPEPVKSSDEEADMDE